MSCFSSVEVLLHYVEFDALSPAKHCEMTLYNVLSGWSSLVTFAIILGYILPLSEVPGARSAPSRWLPSKIFYVLNISIVNLSGATQFNHLSEFYDNCSHMTRCELWH